MANQADSFTPAQKTVSKATGIDEADIKRIRRRLQKLSVIDYQNNRYEHFYFINWTVIIGYALLREPLKVGGNKRPYFVQQPQNEYTNHPLRDITGEYLRELARMKWDKVLETLLLTEDKQS